MPGAIRVIIVSKHTELCTVVRAGLGSMRNIEMVINVSVPLEAENKLTRAAPNLILIDLDTSSADSASLQRLTSRFNSLVILTSYSNARARPYLQGAVKDFVLKPAVVNNHTASLFINTVYKRTEGMNKTPQSVDYKDVARLVDSNKKIIAIASSTGGPDALEKIIVQLPVDVPPIVIVQHMPSGFTRLFANRLNAIYKLDILEAKSGDYLKQGQILLAPADQHMRLVRQAGKLAVECFAGTKMHGVMPPADVLFESVAEIVRANAVGVILTGMGADGARGLMMMHNQGAKTIGQNKETCVVYGMPKVAKDLGAVDFELPLDKIPAKILSLV